MGSSKIGFSRRELLFAAAGSVLSAGSILSAAPTASLRPVLKPSDRQFLEDYAERSFRFFWDQWSRTTGLFMDRGRMDGSPAGDGVGSSAATGFGLTAHVLCIDNDHTILEGMAALLTRWGISCDLATNVDEALAAAAKNGVLVVRSTRVGSGFVNRDVEVNDDTLGFAVSLDLNPQKARILLQLLIANSVTDPKAIQQAFAATW